MRRGEKWALYSLVIKLNLFMQSFQSRTLGSCLTVGGAILVVFGSIHISRIVGKHRRAYLFKLRGIMIDFHFNQGVKT